VPSISQKQLTNPLVKWLFSLTSVKFVKASSDVGRELNQYGTVRIIGSRSRAVPEQTFSDDEVDANKLVEQVRLWQEVTFSVQVYRDTETVSALDIAHKIELNLALSAAQEYFSVSGLGLVKKSRVKGFDVLVANVMEPRANIDLTFNVDQYVTDGVDKIEGIAVEATVTGIDGQPRTTTKLTTRST